MFPVDDTVKAKVCVVAIKYCGIMYYVDKFCCLICCGDFCVAFLCTLLFLLAGTSVLSLLFFCFSQCNPVVLFLFKTYSESCSFWCNV